MDSHISPTNDADEFEPQDTDYFGAFNGGQYLGFYVPGRHALLRKIGAAESADSSAELVACSVRLLLERDESSQTTDADERLFISKSGNE